MQRFDWNNLDEGERRACLARPAEAASAEVLKSVEDIFDRLAGGGDAAILALRKRFDKVGDRRLCLPVQEVLGRATRLPAEDREAIEQARNNIECFHTVTMPVSCQVETMPGVLCRQEYRPIESVGLYVPGGSAPLVSTLLMLAVPAKLAQVKRIVLMTPPRGEALVDIAIAEAAEICGIAEIYPIGGATAIAAMTLGSESIPRVDKIFGPGNIHVSEAKRFAAALPGGPAIDLPAGPSEVMIIADKSAEAEFIAADLLAQAEHDKLAQVLLVTSSSGLADQVEQAIATQLPDLPRREIAAAALANARLILVPDEMIAVAVANAYAPEHLILSVQKPEALLECVTNAGSVFLGNWSPEAAGDYASGTNHVLPTGGAARAFGGLSVTSFLRRMTVQEITPTGLAGLGPAIERLAALEGLEAHRRSVSRRLARLMKDGRAA
jgi:histidinol dehydrogenase